MAYQIKRLGWLPDIPDHRDFAYAAPTAVLKALPAQVDLRNKCPKTVYDQGHLGSCTANAIAGAIEFDQIKHSPIGDRRADRAGVIGPRRQIGIEAVHCFRQQARHRRLACTAWS